MDCRNYRQLLLFEQLYNSNITEAGKEHATHIKGNSQNNKSQSLDFSKRVARLPIIYPLGACTQGFGFVLLFFWLICWF
jgi:hypothetical protein